MTQSRGRSAAQLIMKNIGESVVRIEADALRALADRLAGPMAADFERAVELLYCCAGRVIVTGMGKSGLIARKIAATLTSTGSPALFLHPAEALHGDLGMVVRGDVVLARRAEAAARNMPGRRAGIVLSRHGGVGRLDPRVADAGEARDPGGVGFAKSCGPVRHVLPSRIGSRMDLFTSRIAPQLTFNL